MQEEGEGGRLLIGSTGEHAHALGREVRVKAPIHGVTPKLPIVALTLIVADGLTRNLVERRRPDLVSPIWLIRVSIIRDEGGCQAAPPADAAPICR
jgi:hypothetical protein